MKTLSQLIQEAIPKIEEIIKDDWELMELNPGKPYRNGMKEVHFIKLKVLFERELTNIVKESFKNTRVEKMDTNPETTGARCTEYGYNQALGDLKNKQQQFLVEK